MKKILKRLATGFLAFATIVTALPTTAVHASEKQYWTESAERVGIVEKVMNDGSIGSTFNEGHMTVEGEDAFCVDINTNFRNGYKTRADASTRMSADQISDVALSLEYVKQYAQSHSELDYKQVYLLEQCVVWQRLSVHLGWQCDMPVSCGTGRCSMCRNLLTRLFTHGSWKPVTSSTRRNITWIFFVLAILLNVPKWCSSRWQGESWTGCGSA